MATTAIRLVELGSGYERNLIEVPTEGGGDRAMKFEQYFALDQGHCVPYNLANP
jgi:hypothetical protein